MGANLRILLSAAACEPEKGSEPGVGWEWALELARQGHQVCVLTRAIKGKEEKIARVLSSNLHDECHGSLKFIYYSFPFGEKKPFEELRLPYAQYLIWQWFAAKEAAKLHERMKFDVVHHITFGSLRLPSFMGRLGIPFLFGPVGGGERAPYSLRKSFPLQGKVWDFLRDLSNFVVMFDPFMRMTYRQATRIFVKTHESLKYIPKKFRDKADVRLEIGVEIDEGNFEQPFKLDGEFRFLFAGRFIYWKGMNLGLRAFKNLCEEFPQIRLTMLGKGHEEYEWRRLASEIGIADRVDWISWLPRSDMNRIYREHDVFLFPSLHDSSGNVILEAAGNGLPVICLALGGPGMIVNSQNGIRITELKTEAIAIAALTSAMRECIVDADFLRELSRSAFIWAQSKSWTNVVHDVYGVPYPWIPDQKHL